jgi:CMP-N,N'-diacetyllegionaminic acid synthase
MIQKPKILAIIPARGGSKGLPGKNVRMLNGKPLIAYSIEAALGSKLLDKFVVSTDDENISQISKSFGAEVLPRPKELARDDSSIFDVIMYVIGWFSERGQQFDIIVLLEPTSPLRKKDDIDKAIQLFISNIETAGSLVSLGEVQLENPYITQKIENGFVVPLIDKDPSIYRRQQLPKAYFPYGVIYLSKISTFKEQKSFYQNKTIPYFIERWQNYEVDDLYDFLCIEAIMKYRLAEKKN